MKQNCWEYKRCGRQPGGDKLALGVCPAATVAKLDGVHSGRNSGRACWAVAGTFCMGEVQGTFAEKFKTCEQCDFYAKVKAEEYPKFKLISSLSKMLRA